METLLVFLAVDVIIFYREGKQVKHAQSMFLLVCTGHSGKAGVRRIFVILNFGGNIWLISMRLVFRRSAKFATDM